MVGRTGVGIRHDTWSCHNLAQAQAQAGYVETEAPSAPRSDPDAGAKPARLPGKGIARTLARSAALTLLGLAATALPLHLLLRRELSGAPEEVRSQGWPIRLLHVLFAKFVLQWIEVEGLENLPPGSYLIAANHGYKTGVDGFILGHLLAICARRVPRIVMTAESRSLVVRAERWVLHYYGIALLVPDEAARSGRPRRGLTDIIAAYLRESDRQAILIFPAGRATTDPSLQLREWSTGAVVAAGKCGCPIVPLAIGGLTPDWTPEAVISSAISAEGPEPPFRIHVRIGKPITPTGEPLLDLEKLRDSVANLMQSIPGWREVFREGTVVGVHRDDGHEPSVAPSRNSDTPVRSVAAPTVVHLR
jgi:1-acyl-sn-glycerol-3-phosphate acyltransferase